jgi:ABC-type Fe3+/spermidine/putrescine transport system ATPase subunit
VSFRVNALEIVGVSKNFGDTPALQRVSFDVAQGEIVCLLGPSGCGKTTLLRVVAGLETPDAGQILFEGHNIGPIPPHLRGFGLMFQDYALFPHKDVFENVAFGLRMEGRIEGEDLKARVAEVLKLVGLQGFERRSVNQLSGGEAQRVALARSLATRPRLLMLDEPLGSLDRALRERLMLELRDILKSVGVTTLYVTHDQTEAFAIADWVVVMNTARVEQVGPPETIYCCPKSPFVARFLGLTNLAQGIVVARNRVSSAWGELEIATDNYLPQQQVTVLIRPEAASLLADGFSSEEDANTIRGRLVGRSFRGGRYRVVVEPQRGPPLTFYLTAVEALPVEPGDGVAIALDPAGVVLLPVA